MKEAICQRCFGKGYYHPTTQDTDLTVQCDCQKNTRTQPDIGGERERILNVARCCHDYGGGHHTDGHMEAFQHGITTVVTALEAFFKNPDDSQTRALERVGKSQPQPTPNDSVDAIIRQAKHSIDNGFTEAVDGLGYKYNLQQLVSLHLLLEASRQGTAALEASNEQWKHTAELSVAEKSLPPSHFVLIERAELEKWPCGCKYEDGGHKIKYEGTKCPRCLALERK